MYLPLCVYQLLLLLEEMSGLLKQLIVQYDEDKRVKGRRWR